MGYAKRIQVLTVAMIGIILISLGFFTDAQANTGCDAQILHDSDGKYSGCLVRMGNKEFQVSSAQSSEGGCQNVCSIMAEVKASKGASSSRKTVALESSTSKPVSR